MIIKNKGMFLEEMIRNWNQYIIDNNLGFISKIPTNYKILDSNLNNANIIFAENINCDFIGIFKGNYIEFEAKETEKDFFTISNIKKHQLEKINTISSLGGISFFIIYFHSPNKYFFLGQKEINYFIENKIKKVPLSWFYENGTEIALDNLILNIHKHLFI